MNNALQSLSKTNDSSNNPQKPIPAWLIPAMIAVGFALLFLILFRDRILPATKVQVAAVIATESGDAPAATPHPDAPIANLADAPMAFQATGWIEPDPLPIKATALASGVIDEVHILEGEPVTKDQLLATLVQEDFELELKAATSKLDMRKATLNAHLQTIAAGRSDVDAATARAEEAHDRASRIADLPPGAIAETELTTIRSAERAANAAVMQAKATLQQLVAQQAVLKQEVAIAEVEVDTAKLAHTRSRITSPIDGRVLRLMAAPGQKKILAMDDPDSATIAILYQPGKLQARVDVPLADAAGLQIGQAARIRCNLLPNTIFHGEVTRITGEADITRNTLQAKVRIDDPSEQLRPEMLCRVEFLKVGGTPSDAGISTPTGALTIWAPTAAINNGTAWVCDPESKRVSRRDVQTTDTERDGYLRIRDGLRPGEWVVLSPPNLNEDQRVNPEMISQP